jgi:hypothetical protein
LGKDEKGELEEILKLLRELTKRSSNDRSKPAYRSRGYRLTPRPLGGGYIAKTHHQTPRTEYRSEAKTNYNPKPERQGSYSARPWSEPAIYRPRERLVYDPEVKQILKNIEQKLGSELDGEEILRQLESNPELYERLVERLNEGVDKPEESELAEDEDEKASEHKPELDEQNREEENGEAREKGGLENFPTGESQVRDGLEGSLEDAESTLEEKEGTEPINEVTETQSGFSAPEPSSEVIEQIEAQDLSSLEAELYREPLEPIELGAEPMPSSEPLEQEGKEEVEEY